LSLPGKAFPFRQSPILSILGKTFTNPNIIFTFFSGITNATDGSEDNQIHCFKENGPIPTGFAKLQRARLDEEERRLIELLEEIDLEQDEENGYASDASVDLDE
jgi:hypothetical protein